MLKKDNDIKDLDISFVEGAISTEKDAERLKEIFTVRDTKSLNGSIEITMLVHIISNAFINSILLIMKGFVFHAYAIGRLGVEAFYQISVIEIDFDNHLKIWQEFNYTTKNKTEWDIVKRSYDRVFRYDRKKYERKQMGRPLRSPCQG